jgi:hypothetical protein
MTCAPATDSWWDARPTGHDVTGASEMRHGDCKDATRFRIVPDQYVPPSSREQYSHDHSQATIVIYVIMPKNAAIQQGRVRNGTLWQRAERIPLRGSRGLVWSLAATHPCSPPTVWAKE